MTHNTTCQNESEKPAGRQLAVTMRMPEGSVDVYPRKLDKITHDVRGSISIIVGYTQMMLDEATGKINTAQRQALKDVLACANKLYGLTDEILKRLENTSGEK
jgi:signal transduction histidine kinase